MRKIKMLEIPFWTISQKRKTLEILFRTIKRKKTNFGNSFHATQGLRRTLGWLLKKIFRRIMFRSVRDTRNSANTFLRNNENLSESIPRIFFRKGNLMTTLIQSCPSLQCTVFTVIKSAGHFGLVFTSPWTLKEYWPAFISEIILNLGGNSVCWPIFYCVSLFYVKHEM